MVRVLAFASRYHYYTFHFKLTQMRTPHLFILFQVILLCGSAFSQTPFTNSNVTESVFIDTSIENASPVWYEAGTDGVMVVHLMYDHERNSPNRAAGHLHFKMEAKPKTKVTLEFRNLENIYNGRPGSVAKEMHRMVVSDDGKTWRSVATEVLENRVRLSLEFDSGQLFVARVEPYRISDLERLLKSIGEHHLVDIVPIGKTVDGHQLEIICLGKENAKHHIFLRARAHPWEAGGNWIVEGLIEGLLSENADSKHLLSHCCVWILPMANKDGVARGRTRFNMLGRDLNRNWDVPSDQATSPENFALERWLESRLNSGKRIDFALEIHNDGNGRLHHNMPPEADRARYLTRIATFEDLLRKYTWFSVGHTEGSLATYTLPNGWQHRYGIDGAVHEFNCQWIETLNVGPVKEHWMEYGRGLINVFDQFLEP
jgi:Zinc carboxypeptidase